MRRYLLGRRRSLEERPRLFHEFVERLVEAFGGRVAIIVFGGRARIGLEVVEPRDYDVLVVVGDEVDPGEAEEVVSRVRPRGLPLDVIVVRREELERPSPILARMLRDRVVVYDGLGVFR